MVIASGTVYSHDDPEGRFPFGPVTLDVTTFSFSFPLDLSTPDSFPEDPTSGGYWGAVDYMSLTVNGQSAVILNPDKTHWTTVRDSYTSGSGYYQDVWWTLLRDGDFFVEERYMGLLAVSNSASTPGVRPPLDSDALVAPFVSEYWGEGVDYKIENRNVQPIELIAEIRGSVEAIQIVPIPNSSCDIDTASGFSVGDLMLLERHLTMSISLTAEQRYSCDLNADGILTGADLLLLQQAIDTENVE